MASSITSSSSVRRLATSRGQQTHQLYDFLIPSLQVQSRRPMAYTRIAHSVRSISVSSVQHADAASATSRTSSTATSHKTALTPAQKDFLSRALRVNQAGELAATRIYTAQTPVVVASHPHLRPLMKHMYDQEAGHYDTFNALVAKHRVRPTAMYPLWKVASTALGWSTAMMGREAAMACTEAVETEIGEHYNGQVRILLEMMEEMKARGEEVGEELEDLLQTIRRIRDEELEHLDHAVEHDAKEARPYALLTGVIRAGCRGAIWVSERV